MPWSRAAVSLCLYHKVFRGVSCEWATASRHFFTGRSLEVGFWKLQEFSVVETACRTSGTSEILRTVPNDGTAVTRPRTPFRAPSVV